MAPFFHDSIMRMSPYLQHPYPQLASSANVMSSSFVMRLFVITWPCTYLHVVPYRAALASLLAGAAFYGNEAIVGEGLAEFIAAGRRSELFVTSKVWNTHHKPADAR
jgi:hypothetical protein